MSQHRTICYDVKTTSWCQKNCQNKYQQICHDVKKLIKNMAWWQKVCHDKRFVMTSKVDHIIKNIYQWHHKHVFIIFDINGLIAGESDTGGGSPWVDGGVFFVWWVGPWGFAMSHSGRFVSILATGMASRLDRGWVCYVFVLEGGCPSSGGKRRLIRGGGLVTRISKFDEPQIPVVRDIIPCPTARDVVVSHVGAVRTRGTVTPLSGRYSLECCPTVVRQWCVISGGSGPNEQACCVLCAAVWLWLGGAWLCSGYLVVRTGHRRRIDGSDSGCPCFAGRVSGRVRLDGCCADALACGR